ncbi:MAG: DUF1592 domain-containing protein, partial [Myxococcota bacterium]
MRRGIEACAVVVVACCGVGCYTGRSHDDAGQLTDASPSSSADGGGDGDADGTGGSGGNVPDDPEEAAEHGPLFMARLTRAEYGASIADVLGITVADEDLASLPDTEPSPFDNDTESQSSSATLINGYERLARQVADAVVADASTLETLAPCGAGSDPRDCVEAAVAGLGRRLLRRSLTEDEVQAFADLGDGADYPDAVRVVVTALLQDPEFLFRIEIGEPVDGDDTLRRLGDVELASRLSFLLWGLGPDDALLDDAEAGELSTAEQIVAAAERMLTSPKARRRIERFYALWLGYDVLPHEPNLAAAMRRESDALIGRMMAEGQPWHAALTASDTFLTPMLAEHYGLPAPDAPEGAWVDYPDATRGGVLSHGSFLALGSKFGDTSPVVRGLEVRERLLCLHMGPPPPDLEVDVDSPPPGDATCKVDLYRPMVDQAACAGCHQQLNPVGFGLENFDALGRHRLTEPDRPECVIEGVGELPGIGAFSGPAELGGLLATDEQARLCAGTQMLR